jgi:hypothetical protein
LYLRNHKNNFCMEKLKHNYCFCHYKAPASMKSVVQASWWLTSAFGNLIVIFITLIRISNPVRFFICNLTIWMFLKNWVMPLNKRQCNHLLLMKYNKFLFFRQLSFSHLLHWWFLIWCCLLSWLGSLRPSQMPIINNLTKI